MKIALLGSTGMLGSKMAEIAKSRGHELLTPAHAIVDLNRPHTLEKFFKENSFEALVNCAGFTRVDASEEPAKFSIAMNVNGTSLGWLGKFCARTGRTLLSFSTDYVFDGEKDGPYLETDGTNPLNTYGRTKRQGEKLAEDENPPFYMIRTSWVFGPKGDHFVKTIAGLLKTRSRIEVVEDQIGGPTYTGDLALFSLELLEQRRPFGFYHFSNQGAVSWFGFAQEIQKKIGNSTCKIVPVSSANVFRPAKRPANSRLDLSKSQMAVGRTIRSWQEALGEFLEKEFKNEPA